MEPLFDIKRLQPLISPDVLILTPNQRLANKINQAWNLHCLRQGHRVWEPLRVRALASWVDDCWLQLQDQAHDPALAGARLSSVQEKLIWSQLLGSDEEMPAGAVADNFVDLAQRGWQLAQDWQLSPAQLDNHHHQGAISLARWGRDFDRQLDERQLISTARATAIVAGAFRGGYLDRYRRIVTVGFQNLPPVSSGLLAAAGVECVALPIPEHRGNCSLRIAENPLAEIEAAARWARMNATQNPEARIGVVVPDLAGRRSSVERIFRNCLAPDWTLAGRPYQAAPFNLSAGTSLADTPLVAAALALLGFNARELRLEDLQTVLDCPFWGDFRQHGALLSRSRWLLLESGKLTLSVGDFSAILAIAESQFPSFDAPLSQPLSIFCGQAWLRRQRFQYRYWRDLFLQQLRDLGWPGTRELDSLEFQQQQHFMHLLEEYAALDTMAGTVTLDAALQQLRQMARDSIFQAETPDSPIQVLGTLEAAGLQFSHLWVTGMDETRWPQPTQPHPLLPVPLQRRLGMPRADARQELTISQMLFKLFCHSADEVIFSFSRTDGDLEQRPTHLVKDLPVSVIGVSQPGHPIAARLATSSDLEIIADRQGPSVEPPAGSTETGSPPVGVAIRGGSRMLEDQATCPFNAFATWRLDARPLPEPQLGPDNLVRGTLVHSMLEYFWGDLPDQAALLCLSADAVQERIAASVRKSLSSCSSYDFGPRFRELEQQRLQNLLGRWIQVEQQRRPFRILKREAAASLELEGIRLSLRVDRVDLLENGKLLLLDYKTGDISISGLLSERLTMPQLALYALAAADIADLPLGIVAFAQISAKSVGFKGLADCEDGLAGTKELATQGLPDNWYSTLIKWRIQLNILINEYLSGVATLAFHNKAATRWQAHLEPLNRTAGAEDLLNLLNAGVGTAGVLQPAPGSAPG